MTALPRTVADRLQTAPHRFEGLQALRLAELGPAPAEDGPAGAASGPTRILAERGLAFAPAPVAAVRPGPGGTRVGSAFLGLTGPLGVLPQAYSELVQRADRLRNVSLPAFLDLFNHRLSTLFLQASEKYRLSLQVQRAATDWPAERSPKRDGGAVPGPAPAAARVGADPVSRAMLALAGLGTPHLRERMAVPDEVVLYYAGLFSGRTRPASALQAMLADYLGMPVAIEQFSGRWLPVAAAEQTRLPRPGEPAQFCALGVDAVAGARVWDVQSAFRVVIGPVHRPEMLDLMPDQPLLRRVVDLVRVYAGADLLFDVQVILHRDAVPDLVMHGSAGQTAPKLGWNTWAKSLPALDHKRDIILDPEVVMTRRIRAPEAAPASAEPGLAAGDSAHKPLAGSATRPAVPVFDTATAAVSNAAPTARHTR